MGHGRKQFTTMGLLLAVAQGAWGATYYVAPGGSDSAPGSLAQPFQTLAHAAATAQAGDTVLLRQGVYRETLVAQRSGSPAAPIVFSGYPGEAAVLAGCNAVSGAWHLYQGKIWYLDGLPATWDVYVDGVEMPEARWPNVAPGAAMNTGWAVAAAGTNSTTLVDPNLPAGNLVGARVHVIPGLAWVSNTRGITAYGGGQLSFSSSIGGSSAYWPTAGNLYFLYRALALLDSPGEWYQDPASNRLYLWLPDGGTPTAHSIDIAARKQVVTVASFNDIQLRDLYTFSGGINFTSASGCQVVGVHQKYVHHQSEVDGFGFELTPNQFNGGSGCLWSDGSIDGSSGDGLYIAGTGHTVKDMVIHDVCQAVTYRGAVRMAGSGHLIQGNTLYDSGRYLIFHDQAKGGALRNNLMYNPGLLSSDLGATYCYRANGAGMSIDHNIIHDLHQKVGAGIYLDNASSGYVIHHNLVYNMDCNALILNLPSYDNTVVNNTLYASKNWVNAAGSQYPQEMTGTALVNNLYSGGSRLITGAMAPTLINNGSYTAPPAIFNPGAWTLAAGSPAIDKGALDAPYTNGYCGAAPDQGCYEYGCGAPWSAGATVVVPPFPYPLPGSAATATPSPTPLRTPTASPSRTPSASATPSRTATVTASRTATPGTTATPSPSLSPSPSATPVASATATVSPSTMASATPTPSSSESPSPTTASSSTASATMAATATRTALSTSTATSTTTASGSATNTVTAAMTATLTATATATATASANPTSTAITTVTATGSTSATATATGKHTATATATATAVTDDPSPTASPSAVARPDGDGPLAVLEARMAPDPYLGRGPLRLLLRLAGPCPRLRLRLYSPAFVAVADLEGGPWGPGWQAWTLPASRLDGLRPGLWHLTVQAQDGARRSTLCRSSFYRLER